MILQRSLHLRRPMASVATLLLCDAVVTELFVGSDLGLSNPLGSALAGVTFLVLDRVGVEPEDPFEGTLHDVPMQAITRAFEVDLHQMVGQPANPPVAQTRYGVPI